MDFLSDGPFVLWAFCPVDLLSGYRLVHTADTDNTAHVRIRCY